MFLRVSSYLPSFSKNPDSFYLVAPPFSTYNFQSQRVCIKLVKGKQPIVFHVVFSGPVLPSSSYFVLFLFSLAWLLIFLYILFCFLLQGEERREELSRAGVAKAKEYSWARMAEETAAIYKRAVEE